MIPRVSVIILADGRTAPPDEALATVTAQAFESREAVVVTADAPGAGSVRQPLANLVRRGLVSARGELIALLDAADLWVPEKLSLQVWALEQHPEAALVFTDGVARDEWGISRAALLPKDHRPLHDWIYRNWRGTAVVAGRLDEVLADRNVIPLSSVLVRRGALEKALETLPPGAGAHDLWKAVARRHPVALAYRVAVAYRADRGRHPWEDATMRVAPRVDRHLPVAKRLAARHVRTGGAELGRGRVHEARAMFLCALRYDRRHWPALVYLAASFLPRPLMAAARRAKHQLSPARVKGGAVA